MRSRSKPADGELEPLTQALVEMGTAELHRDYLIAVQILQVYSRRIAALFEKYDVLLTPTLGRASAAPSAPLTTPPDDPTFRVAPLWPFCPFTPFFNATGQPAMSVPLYWNAAGLPVGTHFAADSGMKPLSSDWPAQLEARVHGVSGGRLSPRTLCESKTVPYGSWRSPISSDQIVQGTHRPWKHCA